MVVATSPHRFQFLGRDPMIYLDPFQPPCPSFSPGINNQQSDAFNHISLSVNHDPNLSIHYHNPEKPPRDIMANASVSTGLNLTNMPIQPPPSGEVSNFIDPQSFAARIYFLVLLMLAFTVLRLYMHMRIIRKMGWDDRIVLAESPENQTIAC